MKILPSFAFLMFLSLCLLPYTQAAETMNMTEEAEKKKPPVNSEVAGQVTNVEGDWCVVQDFEGNEWKIQVDKYTTKIGHVLPGVMIIAMIEEDGHAKQVKVLNE